MPNPNNFRNDSPYGLPLEHSDRPRTNTNGYDEYTRPNALPANDLEKVQPIPNPHRIRSLRAMFLVCLVWLVIAIGVCVVFVVKRNADWVKFQSALKAQDTTERNAVFDAFYPPTSLTPAYQEPPLNQTAAK